MRAKRSKRETPKKPKKPKSSIEIVDVSESDLQALCERMQGQVSETDAALIGKLVAAYSYLQQLVRIKGTTIARLRRLFGLRGSEKSKDVLNSGKADDGKGGSAAAEIEGAGTTADTDGARQDGDTNAGNFAAPDVASSAQDTETAEGHGTSNTKTDEVDGEGPEKTKGHGRNGAADYPNAKRCPVKHNTLKPGQRCPECRRGNLYRLAQPKVIIRLFGQPLVDAAITELERLRCSTCGVIFTAKPPDGVSEDDDKYDETAVGIIALVHYGMGFPFNRLDRFQRSLQTPLPSSTQWELMEQAAKPLKPVSDELIRQAASGKVLHNDDTTARILEFMGQRRQKLLERGELEKPDRTGLFTTGVVSVLPNGDKIALFFTGRDHAGENLTKVLKQRDKDLGPPIQMCDALSRNFSKEFATIVSNCIAHGRRHVVDEVENYPAECEHVLTELGKVYKNDATARTEKMTDEDRLAFHQQHSKSVMDDLQQWMQAQLDDKRVEPNSGFGEALTYLLKYWENMTLFLRVAGAPLDNNIVERALKRAIIYRKGSMFYRTENGAQVGDLFMSLFYTAELANENPLDYIVALLKHADLLAQTPADWMPWNYRQTLARLEASPVAESAKAKGSNPTSSSASHVPKTRAVPATAAVTASPGP